MKRLWVGVRTDGIVLIRDLGSTNGTEHEPLPHPPAEAVQRNALPDRTRVPALNADTFILKSWRVTEEGYAKDVWKRERSYRAVERAESKARQQARDYDALLRQQGRPAPDEPTISR